MHISIKCVAAAALSAVLSVPAQAALMLTASDSFTTAPNDVDGLAFDAITGNLFVVSDSSDIFEYDTAGTLLNTIASGGNDLRGLDILPNGNFLAAQDEAGNKRILELDRTTGFVVAGGINIVISLDDSINDDSNGVVFNPLTGTIFHADEDADVVREFSPLGVLLNTIDTGALGVGDTEGIEILNGNLLIADDLEDGNLFEISPAGILLDTFSLPTPQDALALAIDPSGRLFIGQGNEERVDIFTFPIDAIGVPLPATVALLGLGLLGLRLRGKA